MDRRDISKAIVGIAATVGGAGAQRAQAQTCTAPCYAQTNAEVAAGVSPTNLQYAPSHIGDDVRRYGNIDLSGATDCSGILATANSIGTALYFPPGKYRVSANLTLSVPLIFDYGAILEPDAGRVMTVTGSIVAGPWQIFSVANTSNSALQYGTTPVAGPAHVDKIYPEWFGATGNGSSDDSGPFQAAINFAMSTRSGYGSVPVQCLATTYKIMQTLYVQGHSSGGNGSPVNLQGYAGLSTYLDFTGVFSGPTPCIMWWGVESDSHAEMRDLYLKCDSNCIAIEFSGCNCNRAVRCLISNAGEGVRWSNTTSLQYTEQNILDNCELRNCLLTAHYYCPTGDDNSFHGSGFVNRCLIAPGGSPIIIIDANALPYLCPIDIDTFDIGTTTTLFHNLQNSYQNVNFFGTITCEHGQDHFILADTCQTLFAGNLLFDGPNVSAGTLVQVRGGAMGTTGSFAPLGAEQAQVNVPLTTGANALPYQVYIAAQQFRKMFLQITASNYEYAYELSIYLTGTGAYSLQGPIGSAPVPLYAYNAAGYGAPTLSMNASTGQVVVTNSSWPSSGVTATFSERALGAGISGGAQTGF